MNKRYEGQRSPALLSTFKNYLFLSGKVKNNNKLSLQSSFLLIIWDCSARRVVVFLISKNCEKLLFNHHKRLSYYLILLYKLNFCVSSRVSQLSWKSCGMTHLSLISINMKQRRMYSKTRLFNASLTYINISNVRSLSSFKTIIDFVVILKDRWLFDHSRISLINFCDHLGW